MTQTRARRRAAAEEPAVVEATPRCHVCGDPVEANLDSTCGVCSRPVHVSWREGDPDSACSRIVSPMGCCGIAFVCNVCADAEEAEHG